jgi:hypothetical protein
MSFTLMEGAIVVFLLWIAWRIGRILGPYILRRMRDRSAPPKFPPDRKDKPPIIIDN